MRNIIEQIIEYYPNDVLIITMESGENVSGRAGSLLPGLNTNPNAEIFQLVNEQSVLEESLSVCKIVSITVTSATYNNAITYLPAPNPPYSGCDINCEEALRISNQNVLIKAGNRTVAIGYIFKNEYGMVVVVGNNNLNPSFVSLCKTEIVKK